MSFINYRTQNEDEIVGSQRQAIDSGQMLIFSARG